MEWLLFVGTAGIVLCIIFIKGIYDEHKRHQNFIKELKSNYGQKPKRKYSLDEFEALTHNHMRNRNNYNGFMIDDITWNDLDMDNIFMLINHTLSDPGQEYLYDCLRKPLFEEDVLIERNRIIEYFMNHEEERIKFQDTFARMGRNQRMSISDYLYFLDDLPERNNLIHYLCMTLGVFSMIMIFANPALGFGVFIVTLIVNIAMYFKRKGEIDPYITTFRYLMRVMKETEKIKMLKIPEIGEYFDELDNILKTLRGFCKNSYILMSSQRLTGNIMELPLDYLRLFFHLDLVKFNSMLKIVKEHKKDFERLLEIIGFLDATIAIGAFRKSLIFYTKPTFLKENKQAHAAVRIEDLYHPMIEHPICNSISSDGGVLLTGSNASGKSTFLKSVAINALLSQTIYTALARECSTNFFRIYSSMALSDNLSAGESYYMVEIKSMKRVLDASKEDANVLCFVDEVLRGTNTAERIAASSYILKELNRRNVICFAATHDIELTHILEEHFENYHFTEQVTDHDIYFPYQLYKGRTESRNAIKLLDLIGYEQNITSAAEKACENFIENGVWEKV